MASHDYGMVGLVKRLIDHTAANSIRTADGGAAALPVESMTVRHGMVVLRKTASP
jgi:hypothetical protein